MRLRALEGMGMIALVMGVRAVAFFLVLAGVPCWFYARLIVNRKKKKLVAAGKLATPRPPSLLRKTVQGMVSIFFIVIWCAAAWWNISQYAYPFFWDEPIPYIQTGFSRTPRQSFRSRKEYHFTEIDIIPDRDAYYSAGELAATCMAATKFYREKYGYKYLRINISGCPDAEASVFSGKFCRLGVCVYEEAHTPQYGDGWRTFSVTDQGNSQQCLINRLWLHNKRKFTDKTGKLNEKALREAIAAKLGIDYSRAFPKEFELKDALYFLLGNVQPEAPQNETEMPCEEKAG